VPTTGSRTATREEGTLTFPVVDDLATLTWLANLAAIELHVHQWRVSAQGEPLGADRIVIDLDPGDPAGLHECAQVALLAREKLAGLGLSATPVLSGSKGIHLYATLADPLPSDDATAVAKGVAEQLQKEHPALVTAAMTKAKRPGKVFLDWSQNAGSKTTVCPYSLRGRERPTAAAPLTWAEVEEGAQDPLALEQLGFEEVLARVQAQGDLFAADRDGREEAARPGTGCCNNPPCKRQIPILLPWLTVCWSSRTRRILPSPSSAPGSARATTSPGSRPAPRHSPSSLPVPTHRPTW
jgi:bifunctional non-homologous end joining protein LigD